jgi:hypothetical protein
VTGVDRQHGPDHAIDQTRLFLLAAPSIVGELHAVAGGERRGAARGVKHMIFGEHAALPVNLAGKPIERIHLLICIGEDEPLLAGLGRDVAGIAPLQGFGGLAGGVRPVDRALLVKDVERLAEFPLVHQIESALLVEVPHALHRVKLGRLVDRA